ncbi:heme-binding protein [Pseudomonas sp. ICMP22404]|uniref:GlcG/HbpS family heme-binding protein n=1 Tax=Pseudomonas sp. ICMP22404 TaxID=2583807 RepID=UPI00111AD9BE|nr:heme-binding protein [Pseudomonas sp. ICMP22404]TNF83426.1 heme-binding protein [Pseudomonas sp. ICMP22404]
MAKRLTHEAALLGLAAGVRKAKELNQRSTLSIVDDGGHLVASIRVDDAAFGTIEIAHNKAYTAAAFRQSTAAWMDAVQPGAALYGLERSCARPFVVFGGGFPVFDGDLVIGGVGVSGGPVEADEAIANAIVSTLQKQ